MIGSSFGLAAWSRPFSPEERDDTLVPTKKEALHLRKSSQKKEYPSRGKMPDLHFLPWCFKSVVFLLFLFFLPFLKGTAFLCQLKCSPFPNDGRSNPLVKFFPHEDIKRDRDLPGDGTYAFLAGRSPPLLDHSDVPWLSSGPPLQNVVPPFLFPLLRTLLLFFPPSLKYLFPAEEPRVGMCFATTTFPFGG